MRVEAAIRILVFFFTHRSWAACEIAFKCKSDANRVDDIIHSYL